MSRAKEGGAEKSPGCSLPFIQAPMLVADGHFNGCFIHVGVPRYFEELGGNCYGGTTYQYVGATNNGAYASESLKKYEERVSVIIGYMRKVLENKPDTQFFITQGSPYFHCRVAQELGLVSSFALEGEGLAKACEMRGKNKILGAEFQAIRGLFTKALVEQVAERLVSAITLADYKDALDSWIADHYDEKFELVESFITFMQEYFMCVYAAVTRRETKDLFLAALRAALNKVAPSTDTMTALPKLDQAMIEARATKVVARIEVSLPEAFQEALALVGGKFTIKPKGINLADESVFHYVGAVSFSVAKEPGFKHVPFDEADVARVIACLKRAGVELHQTQWENIEKKLASCLVVYQGAHQLVVHCALSQPLSATLLSVGAGRAFVTALAEVVSSKEGAQGPVVFAGNFGHLGASLLPKQRPSVLARGHTVQPSAGCLKVTRNGDQSRHDVLGVEFEAAAIDAYVAAQAKDPVTYLGPRVLLRDGTSLLVSPEGEGVPRFEKDVAALLALDPHALAFINDAVLRFRDEQRECHFLKEGGGRRCSVTIDKPSNICRVVITVPQAISAADEEARFSLSQDQYAKLVRQGGLPAQVTDTKSGVQGCALKGACVRTIELVIINLDVRSFRGGKRVHEVAPGFRPRVIRVNLLQPEASVAFMHDSPDGAVPMAQSTLDQDDAREWRAQAASNQRVPLCPRGSLTDLLRIQKSEKTLPPAVVVRILRRAMWPAVSVASEGGEPAVLNVLIKQSHRPEEGVLTYAVQDGRLLIKYAYPERVGKKVKLRNMAIHQNHFHYEAIRSAILRYDPGSESGRVLHGKAQEIEALKEAIHAHDQAVQEKREGLKAEIADRLEALLAQLGRMASPQGRTQEARQKAVKEALRPLLERYDELMLEVQHCPGDAYQAGLDGTLNACIVELGRQGSFRRLMNSEGFVYDEIQQPFTLTAEDLASLAENLLRVLEEHVKARVKSTAKTRLSDLGESFDRECMTALDKEGATKKSIDLPRGFHRALPIEQQSQLDGCLLLRACLRDLLLLVAKSLPASPDSWEEDYRRVAGNLHEATYTHRHYLAECDVNPFMKVSKRSDQTRVKQATSFALEGVQRLLHDLEALVQREHVSSVATLMYIQAIVSAHYDGFSGGRIAPLFEKVLSALEARLPQEEESVLTLKGFFRERQMRLRGQEGAATLDSAPGIGD